MGKIDEHEGKKYLIIDDHMINEALDKIKKMDIEKFDDSKILIDMDDKFQIILLSVVILMICVIKDNDKYCPQIFLGEILYIK